MRRRRWRVLEEAMLGKGGVAGTEKAKLPDSKVAATQIEEGEYDLEADWEDGLEEEMGGCNGGYKVCRWTLT